MVFELGDMFVGNHIPELIVPLLAQDFVDHVNLLFDFVGKVFRYACHFSPDVEFPLRAVQVCQHVINVICVDHSHRRLCQFVPISEAFRASLI